MNERAAPRPALSQWDVVLGSSLKRRLDGHHDDEPGQEPRFVCLGPTVVDADEMSDPALFSVALLTSFERAN